jgi:ParB-like chromosome segregation protein Spo0J
MKIPTRLIKCEWPPTLEVNQGDVRFDELFNSIQKEGIKDPITINLQWRVLDGNHRLAVARLLGIDTVEVRVWTETEFIV